MPTPTYTALANTTLGSSASSVTFSSISQNYRDLILVVTGKTSTNGPDSVLIRFNSDSGSNYAYVRMLGTGTTASSYSGADNGIAIGIVSNTTNQSTFIASIMDYSATDKHKTALSRSGLVDGFIFASAGRWSNTAAITSVQIIEPTQTLSAGMTLALYGVIA
jgi:hypothetical protein